jgi:sugar lactone lactonase YvrE
MNNVERVLHVGNQLGEGPVWSQTERALYWVDILGHKIHRFYPATGHSDIFDVSSPVTVLAFRTRGGFVTATANRLAFWDSQSQKFDFIANLEVDEPDIRFNDGAVDPTGRLWVGTMNEKDNQAPDGVLYRLDSDLSVHKVAAGFTVSNGIGWSPDHKIMYFTDTMRQVILAYDYDPASGAIENSRTFAYISEAEGYPDGLTVDSEGFVWSAHWGGWRVTRYDPTGKIERVVKMPAPNATSCAFGGDNLDELYITTAWAGLGEKERQDHPAAGDLFRIKLEVKGIAESEFAG